MISLKIYKRQKLKIAILFILGVLTLSIALFSVVSYAQTPSTITITPYVYFGFSNDNSSWLNFDSESTVTISQSTNGEYWYFNGYGFCFENGNGTISDLVSTNTLSYQVAAASEETSTTLIYTSNLGKPMNVEVNGVDVPVVFDDTTGILTVEITHSSPAEVDIFFDIRGTSAQMISVLAMFLPIYGVFLGIGFITLFIGMFLVESEVAQDYMFKVMLAVIMLGTVILMLALFSTMGV